MANEQDNQPRRGRPPAEEPGTTASVWLRQKEYDRLVQAANRREQSVSAYVRQILIVQLR